MYTNTLILLFTHSVMHYERTGIMYYIVYM